jgi:predicted HTH transcriptional regulator
VEQSDIYIGLLGNEYGNTDSEGVSATEREFDYATQLNKTRLIFISGKNNTKRDERENKLIKKAEQFIVRQKFTSQLELKSAVYASLISYLEDREYIHSTPFDATLHREATLNDIDEEKVKTFLAAANIKRQYPLDVDTPFEEVLTRLNLLRNNRLTNAAILLFGKKPQNFFITSEVKCMHFHGTEVVKPIPSYQIYKGDVFQMIEQAVDFVLSKIDLRIGLRETSIYAPAQYELPMFAVKEAIVNAVCHRDYTSNGSVQVMLFKDRLEIWNPGHLPFGLTVEDLYSVHSSLPTNPLIAEPMYLNGTIEKAGTGTNDIIKLCKEWGLREPEYRQQALFRVVLHRNNVVEEETAQVTPQVTPQVRNLLMVMEGYLSMAEIQNILKISDRKFFRLSYIKPALEQGYIAPEFANPNHPKQRYYLTEKGNLQKKHIENE